MKTQKFVVRNLSINLASDKMVWPPSEYARIFAFILDTMSMKQLDVCDLGSGSGVLGILCALKGAKVTSLDLNPKAVSLTDRNACLNDVKIQCLYSNGFSAFSENTKMYFDMIICNPPTLPQNNVPMIPKNAGHWNQNGNGRVVLDQALYCGMNYLKKGGKLIACSSSEQDWAKTEKALKNWKKWRTLKIESFPMGKLYTPFLSKWLELGIIRKVGNEFFHDVHFFEAIA